jgi:hypothetical protein
MDYRLSSTHVSSNILNGSNSESSGHWIVDIVSFQSDDSLTERVSWFLLLIRDIMRIQSNR